MDDDPLGYSAVVLRTGAARAGALVDADDHIEMGDAVGRVGGLAELSAASADDELALVL